MGLLSFFGFNRKRPMEMVSSHTTDVTPPPKRARSIEDLDTGEKLPQCPARKEETLALALCSPGTASGVDTAELSMVATSQELQLVPTEVPTLEVRLHDETFEIIRDESAALLQLREEHRTCASELLRSVEDIVIAGLPGGAQDFVSDVCEKLRAVSDSPLKELVIPVFGMTGAGKSTLLNAILGTENVLMTSDWCACTSVPIYVRFAEGPFRAEVQLKSLSQWRREREEFLKDLKMKVGQSINRKPQHSKLNGEENPAAIAYETLRAVYPEAFKTRLPWSNIQQAIKDLDRCKNKVTSVHREHQVISFQEASAAHLMEVLADYVVSKEEGSEEAAFWPLVEQVRLYGPFRGLHRCIVLVDVPGLEDSNAARSAVAKQMLAKADGIVIAASIKRAASEKLAQSILHQSFRRQMLMDGHFSRPLAFVATQSDDVDRARGQTRLSSAVARNLKVKEAIRKTCHQGLGDIDDDESDDISAAAAPEVFTASAKDYQRLMTPDLEDGRPGLWETLQETEIPAIRLWLHQHGQQALLQQLLDLEQQLKSSCERLREAGGGGHMEMVNIRADQVKATTKERLVGTLEDHKSEAEETLWSMLEAPLAVGASHGAAKAIETMGSRCRPKGVGGVHHATFQATARRFGEWHENWNELLTEPMKSAFANKWNEVLNQELPRAIDRLSVAVKEQFRASATSGNLPCAPFDSAADVFLDSALQMKHKLREGQMELSRELPKKVKDQMSPCYVRAAAQHGTGMDVRQKQIVLEHVTLSGAEIFSDVKAQLKDGLQQLLNQVWEEAAKAADTALDVLGTLLARLAASQQERSALQLLSSSCQAVVESCLRGHADRVVRLHALEHSQEESDKDLLPLQDEEAEEEAMASAESEESEPEDSEEDA